MLTGIGTPRIVVAWKSGCILLVLLKYTAAQMTDNINAMLSNKISKI